MSKNSNSKIVKLLLVENNGHSWASSNYDNLLPMYVNNGFSMIELVRPDRRNNILFLNYHIYVYSVNIVVIKLHGYDFPCFIMTQKLSLTFCMSGNSMDLTVYHSWQRQSKNIDILLNLFYFITCDRNCNVMYQIPVTYFSSKAALHCETHKPVVSALFSRTD